MILLQTTRSFYGSEDHALTDRLLAERPGILLWAIQGWQTLRRQGRFTQPDGALESLAEMSDLASPVGAFVQDCCNVAPDDSVTVGELFSAWEKWCEEHGRKKLIGTVQVFARDIHAAVPGIVRRRPRDAGSRQRIYVGIGLKQGF